MKTVQIIADDNYFEQDHIKQQLQKLKRIFNMPKLHKEVEEKVNKDGFCDYKDFELSFLKSSIFHNDKEKYDKWLKDSGLKVKYDKITKIFTFTKKD